MGAYTKNMFDRITIPRFIKGLWIELENKEKQRKEACFFIKS